MRGRFRRHERAGSLKVVAGEGMGRREVVIVDRFEVTLIGAR
jgi:hypothetical protein